MSEAQETRARRDSAISGTKPIQTKSRKSKQSCLDLFSFIRHSRHFFNWLLRFQINNLLPSQHLVRNLSNGFLSLPRPGDRPRLVSFPEVSTISVFVEATVEESVFQAADATGRSRQALVLSNRAASRRPLQRDRVTDWGAVGCPALDRIGHVPA